MGKLTRSLSFWTLEQFNQVLPYVTDVSARTALLALFYDGMCYEELLALTPADLDYTAGTISITQSLQHKSTEDIITGPKTSNGVRTISMPSVITEAIMAYCNMQYGLSDRDRIFSFTKSLIRGNMKRCATKADVPLIRIHDLRHSHVSLLIDMDFSPHLIAEKIGDTVQMVNSTYGHLYPNQHQAVADKLNALIVPN